MPRKLTDADVIKAVSHPIRRQIMTLIGTGEASATEIATQIGQPVQTVSYHMGILRELELLILTRETPRRGAMERHYKASIRSLTVRELVDWLLVADQARPRGWEARIVELDGVGEAALAKTRERFLADLDKLARAAADRLTKDPQRRSNRIGVAQLSAVLDHHTGAG